MDFDHSEDVVNQEDITLEDTGRLDTISMDMDDIGHSSHNLMEGTNDEVIGMKVFLFYLFLFIP